MKPEAPLLELIHSRSASGQQQQDKIEVF